MKTTIGIIQTGQTKRICNIASEFFGVRAADKTGKGKIIWLTFPSQKAAREFSEVINIECIDVNHKVLE